MACRDVWNTCHEDLQSPSPEGFVAIGSPRAVYFTHHGKPWLKPIIACPLGKKYGSNCSYLTQMKSTMTAIDDSNRRRNKTGLSCSRKATAPLILIFKLLFRCLSSNRHFTWITQLHNRHSSKHTNKNITWLSISFVKYNTKMITHTYTFTAFDDLLFVGNALRQERTCILQRFSIPSFLKKMSNEIRK